MSLIHALVARESVILAENRSGKRDFSNAVATILSKIPPNNSKLTYVWNSTSSTMSPKTASHSSSWLMMQLGVECRLRLSRSSTAVYTAYSRDQIDDAPAYGLNEFSSQVGKLIEQYNIAPPVDALSQAQQDLAQVKDIMVHNDNMLPNPTPFDEGREQFEDSSSGETSGLWL
ncbi:VAMP synaptobrevin-like protein [Rhizoctonia solani]|uniref:VAMP synaptobrevin-like protein n=1 Tax=Rhizoctonia solani TaxID=456999 RepID=A0A8H7LYZ1_9AGAM|nr:VAMP synaptobrevin-like protein [Rhizoctonia solani]